MSCVLYGVVQEGGGVGGGREGRDWCANWWWFCRAKPQSLFAKMDKDRKAGVEGSKEGEGVEEGKA